MYTTTDMRQFAALQMVNDGFYFDETGKLFCQNASRIEYGRLLEENQTQTVIDPYMCILHTNAGSGKASIWNLWRWLNNKGNNGESTFQIQWDGVVGQYMLATRRADCNFNANAFYKDGKMRGALSFETADEGAATVETTLWNNEQLDTIIAICAAWVIQWEGDCGDCPTWDSKGIDYHTRHPYINAFVKAWTNVKGKTCPGAARKRQLPLIRAAVANRVIAYVQQCQKMGIKTGIKWVDAA